MPEEQTAVIRRPAFDGGAIWRDDDRVLVFDATISDEATDDAEVTDYEVEGAFGSDHYRPLPAMLSLDVFWTDAPLGAQTPERDRSVRFYETLLEIKDNHEIVSVLRSYRLFRSMVITSVRKRHTSRDGRGNVRVAITFKEVRLVSFAQVLIPASQLADLVRDRATDDSDRGRQPTDTPTGADEAAIAERASAPRPSGLYAIGDALGYIE